MKTFISNFRTRIAAFRPAAKPRGADLRGARIDPSTDFSDANIRSCLGCPALR